MRVKRRSPGAGEAALQAAAGALVLLAVDEMLEELRRAPPAFGGQGHDIVEVGGGVAEAKSDELVSERRHRGARRPSAA
jgi:hypothetical protein